MARKKASARDEELEEAAAATMWWMSCASRVEGSMRRSLVKVVAIPPVARMPQRSVNSSDVMAIRYNSMRWISILS